MKEIKKGNVFIWKGFKVIVTDTGIDSENGREWATIKPTGNYGYPIDIYLDAYDMKLGSEKTYTYDEVTDIIDVVTNEVCKMIDELYKDIDYYTDKGESAKAFECKTKLNALLECKYKMFKKAFKLMADRSK